MLLPRLKQPPVFSCPFKRLNLFLSNIIVSQDRLSFLAVIRLNAQKKTKMIEQRYLGKLCPFAKSCPVYQGKLIVEKVSTMLIRNVFCNRSLMGWKNCKRYTIAKEGLDVPEDATPYQSSKAVG